MTRWRPLLSCLAVLIAGFLLPASAAADGIYSWVDEEGVVHYTDQPNEATGQEPVDLSGATVIDIGGENSDQEKKKSIRDKRYGGRYTRDEQGVAEVRDNFGRGEAYWRTRYAKAKQDVAKAEEKYEATQKKALATCRWATRRQVDPGTTKECAEFEEEVTELKKELNTARQYLHVVLPEQARKAGAPPGWVRG